MATPSVALGGSVEIRFLRTVRRCIVWLETGTVVRLDFQFFFIKVSECADLPSLSILGFEIFIRWKWSLLTLTAMDGPSTCLWPITGVPQFGQNLIALAFDIKNPNSMWSVSTAAAPCGTWSSFQTDSPSMYRHPFPLRTDHWTRARPRGSLSVPAFNQHAILPFTTSQKNGTWKNEKTFEQMLQLHAKTCFSSGSRTENLKAPQ